MTDVSQTVSRVLTTDGNADPYDHQISLVDTTAPEAPPTQPDSPAIGSRRLGRIPTKGSLKDQYTKLKYARYQENRYSKSSNVTVNTEDSEDARSEPQSAVETHPTITEGEAIDFGPQQPPKKPKKDRGPLYEVDVLYENQRGSFIFGIPLYSHSSLLNFDPSPWVTKEFKGSAVNITNAQVPDPTWQWAWKTWYVDMSYDVDEEGWQYSFMFGNRFAWHGTHPWFHSFVRRRRWLRKRVKKTDHRGGTADSMNAGHNLTAEYFTIHPKRDKSPESRRPESYVSDRSREVEEPPDEIKDIATLLRALKAATVDREKLDLVKKFVDSAGDELSLLGEHIPAIMAFLVFQNSRQLLLVHLKQTANEAQQHRDEHDAEDRPEGEAERRRIDSLLAAVESANKQISGLEYWSDRDHVLKTIDGDVEGTRPISTIFDDPASTPDPEEKPFDSIDGISKRAELDLNPTENLVQRMPGAEDKGKAREVHHENVDDDVEAEEKAGSPPRLKMDQVLIPDTDQ